MEHDPAAEVSRMDQLVSIQAFAQTLAQKKKAAIDGRKASGIEKVWAEDEDHYEGIDDLNRGDAGYSKPRTANGRMVAAEPKRKGFSTAFLKITRPYCDAAAARVADMLLPTDDRNWAMRPTPAPDLIKQLQDQTPVTGPDGQPMMRPAPQAQEPGQPPGMMRRMVGAVGAAFGAQPQQAQPAMQPVTAADMAEKAIAQAKQSCEVAQRYIDDWLVECRYHGEVRKVIDSCARTGTGILKGPAPVKKTSRAAERTETGFALKIKTETKPTSLYVRNWNFYPDPNCGDNIQKGAYTWERDDITARKLRELKGTTTSDGTPIYIDEMIDLCLEEGPAGSTENQRREKPVTDDDLFEIWHFHGQVDRKDMEAAGCKCGSAEAYPCQVTMVNDRVIKVNLSPLDSGEFPYDVMVWQPREDSWAGIGVARQMRECQKGANAAVRNLMDNAGLSGGPQIIIDSSKIEPVNGKWEIVPRKMWRKKHGGPDLSDVRDAFTIVSIETRQSELLAILQFWLKQAEDVTGLPMLLQGQQGGAPDTLGGQTMAMNSASGVLRRIARIFDDRVTEPHIGRYYEWLLLHGPEDAKGDFTIDARGSSALVERDLQNQAMMQMLGVSLNPAYGIDPELTVNEVLKGMRIDPKRVAMSAEKKQQLAQNQPKDPRIAAAEIMAGVRKMETDSDERIAMLENETEKYRIQVDTDRDTAYVGAEAQKNAEAAQNAIRKLQVEIELAMVKKQSELDKLKAKLADTSMRLTVQKDLSMAAHTVDLHKNKQAIRPAAEPAGRAQPGKAFQQ